MEHGIVTTLSATAWLCAPSDSILFSPIRLGDPQYAGNGVQVLGGTGGEDHALVGDVGEVELD